MKILAITACFAQLGLGVALLFGAKIKELHSQPYGLVLGLTAVVWLASRPIPATLKEKSLLSLWVQRKRLEQKKRISELEKETAS